VPPGVEIGPAISREDAREALGLPREGPVIGFVARLTAIKRPDRALAVFDAVRQRHPDAVLAVAGEGPLLDEVRAAAEPLGASVRFLGWVADVQRLYAACDLTLLTSDNEGMPVSLIEAAVAGLPAVATAVGSTAEVVRDGVTGYVRKTDAELVDAIDALLADAGLRERMGEAAAAWGREQFGGARLVRDVAAIYDELAG
jgi:glycosyltransferase involved in cell wall biosynthesis